MIKIFCYFVTLWIIVSNNHVKSDLYQTFEENERFYLFKNKVVVGINKPFKEEEHVDFKTCLSICMLDKKNCKSLMIFKKNITQDYSCQFFKYGNISSVKDSTNAISYLVRKGGEFCSEHCKRLNPKKLCGECKCVDTCGVLKNYHCNCTNAITVMKSCKDLSENQISGWYLIDPDQKGSFQVLCFIQRLEISNRDINCTFKNNTFIPFENTKGGISDTVTSFSSCITYCYSSLSKRNFNGWSYYNKNEIQQCSCALDAKTESKVEGWMSCIVKLTKLEKQLIYLATTVMMHREANTEPSFWNKTLEEYFKGFYSADNYWIGLYQLERISNKFTLDMKVVMITKSMNDTVTVYYRDIKLKKISGVFTLSFSEFDSNKARSLGDFNNKQINIASKFQQCKSGGIWWTLCTEKEKLPTYPTEDYGFGNIDDVKTITFLLITKK
ncbi:uncharacterized protein LOC105843652 isoform X2 [Hydra vulgaris]|uniref:Uncharacterized protein LOC105843652 isoform X2 n=1 Tax=Hydra vulgaris TaxID=6087 RepID=A0ABM4CV49_HYDVU